MSISILSSSRLYSGLCITALLITVGVSAQAACPDINTDPSENVGAVPIPGTYSETVFFCKQNFSPTTLTFSPSPETIVAGGSQTISMGNTTRTLSLTQSIQLPGFTPSNLNVNLNTGTLTAFFPNSGGYKNSPSLFNFYTKVAAISRCDSAPRGGNQFELMKRHLRNNPNIFTLVGQTALPQRADTAQDIVKFTDAHLINRSNPTQKIIADVTLYHANTNVVDASFQTTIFPRYCWLGVGARIDLKNMNLSNTGNYDLTLGVNIQ